MRRFISAVLIMLMAVLPISSVAAACHHVQPMLHHAVATEQVMLSHHCCHDQQQTASAHDLSSQSDRCHCDQFQNGQFILSLLAIPVVIPSAYFVVTTAFVQPLSDHIDLLYRPPIA